MKRIRLYLGIVAMFSGLLALHGAEYAEQHGDTGITLACIGGAIVALFIGIVQVQEGSR